MQMLKYAGFLIFSGLLAAAILSPHVYKAHKQSSEAEATTLSNNQETIAQDTKASQSPRVAQMRAGRGLAPAALEGDASTTRDRRSWHIPDVRVLQEAAKSQAHQAALAFKPTKAASLLETTAATSLDAAPKVQRGIIKVVRRLAIEPQSSRE